MVRKRKDIPSKKDAERKQDESNTAAQEGDRVMAPAMNVETTAEMDKSSDPPLRNLLVRPPAPPTSLRSRKICLVSSKQCYDIEKETLEELFYDLRKKITGKYIFKTKRVYPRNAEAELKKLEKRFDCIIPCDVRAQQFCAKYLKDSAKLFTSDHGLYEKLDDKRQMVQLPFTDAPFPGIEHIPTFDCKVQSVGELPEWVEKTKSEKYLLKETLRDGGSGQRTVSKSWLLAKFTAEKFQKCIIQPYMEAHKVYAVNFFAKNGQLVDFMVSVPEKALTPEAYKKGHYSEILDMRNGIAKKLVNFTRQFVKKHNVSGIMEVEFLWICNHLPLYILEVNPRLTGVWHDVDRKDQSYYVSRVVVPYIESITGSKIPEPEFSWCKPGKLRKGIRWHADP